MNLLLGALWRRWWGLAGTGPRLPKALATFVLAWSFYLAFDVITALCLHGLALFFFIPGHKVDDKVKVQERYRIFGWCYTLAIEHWRNEWNRPPFIDGAMAAAELAIGGLFWGLMEAVALSIWWWK